MQHRLLTLRRRRHDADGAAIVIHCHGIDHRLDLVTIGQRPRQRLQHHQAQSLPWHHAIGGGIKGAADAIGRQGAGLIEQLVGAGGWQQADTASQRHVAMPQTQRIAGLLQGHQRRGTGGVDGECRALEVERMADACGDDVEQIGRHQQAVA